MKTKTRKTKRATQSALGGVSGSTSDSAMVDWIGVHVDCIASIESGKNWTIEVTWYPTGDDMQITRATGKTEVIAFRKCVTKAMGRMSNQQICGDDK